MSDHALVLRSPVPLGEEVAERLRSLGTSGIWQVSAYEWRAYFPDEDTALARELSRGSPNLSAVWEAAEGVDWASRYQAALKPLPIGRRFSILPSPDLRNPWPDRIGLCLVPGTAFGTGEHYTTASCLSFLEEIDDLPDSVLDVGCGTGILAAAACRLGARKVVACDTDPEACRVARATRTANGASYRVALESARGIRGRFGLIFANILAETLVEIFPDLRARALDRALLIGSGVAAPKASQVFRAARLSGFELEGMRADGAWRSMLWKARAS